MEEYIDPSFQCTSLITLFRWYGVIVSDKHQRLGGSNHSSSIWPQFRDKRHVLKSKLDNVLHNLLITGEIDQGTAIAKVYENVNELYGLGG